MRPRQVKLGPELGQGSFGTTYRGWWRGGEQAVKHVRVSTPDEATSFLREVHALSSLRHPNVMPFFGEPPPLEPLSYPTSSPAACCQGSCRCNRALLPDLLCLGKVGQSNIMLKC